MQPSRIGRDDGCGTRTDTIVHREFDSNTEVTHSSVETGTSLTNRHCRMVKKHIPIVPMYNALVLPSEQPTFVRRSAVHCMYCNRFCQNTHNVKFHEETCKNNPSNSKYVSDIIDVCTSIT